jgi:holin-like protein
VTSTRRRSDHGPVGALHSPVSGTASAHTAPALGGRGRRWLEGLLVLVGYLLVAEALVRLLRLPVPAPVLGLALLAVTTAVPAVGRRLSRPHSGLAAAGDGLLAHLPLLFVPAGVGVVRYGPQIAADAGFLAVALPVSLVLTLAATGLTLSALLRRQRARQRAEAGTALPRPAA